MNPESPPLDLSSLRGALASLLRALTRWQATDSQDEELRDACIQRFEYTFELSWKMLRRRLELDLPDAQAVDAMSFRELMRGGGERGLVRDVDAWMVFRDKRNITSHTYNAAKAADVAAVIPAFAQHAQELLAQLEARGASDA
jgi:nucleotidyltransferase substrate binding protein (TIGR01987 family)